MRSRSESRKKNSSTHGYLRDNPPQGTVTATCRCVTGLNEPTDGCTPFFQIRMSDMQAKSDSHNQSLDISLIQCVTSPI